MEEVRVAEKRLSDYRAIIGGPAFAEILALASKLKGKRVAHVNATGYGGGGAAPPPHPAPPDPVGVAAPRPPPGSLRRRRLRRPRVRPADGQVPADLRESARDRSDEPEEPPRLSGGAGDDLASVRCRFRTTRDHPGRPLRSVERSARRHRCVSARKEEDSEGAALVGRLDGPGRSRGVVVVQALGPARGR